MRVSCAPDCTRSTPITAANVLRWRRWPKAGRGEPFKADYTPEAHATRVRQHGDLVLSKTDLTNTGRIELNVSKLLASVYMVRMVSDGKAFLGGKLVIAG